MTAEAAGRRAGVGKGAVLAGAGWRAGGIAGGKAAATTAVPRSAEAVEAGAAARGGEEAAAARFTVDAAGAKGGDASGCFALTATNLFLEADAGTAGADGDTAAEGGEREV